LAAGNFEVHWDVVEMITVLFKLFDDAGEQVPSGWGVTLAKFEV